MWVISDPSFCHCDSHSSTLSSRMQGLCIGLRSKEENIFHSWGSYSSKSNTGTSVLKCYDDMSVVMSKMLEIEYRVKPEPQASVPLLSLNTWILSLFSPAIISFLFFPPVLS